MRIVSVQGALYGGIGWVRLKNFQERTDASLRRELDRLRTENGGRELSGVVLDLRNNPGGLLDQAVAVSDRFLPAAHHRHHPRPRGAEPHRGESRDQRARSLTTRWSSW